MGIAATHAFGVAMADSTGYCGHARDDWTDEPSLQRRIVKRLNPVDRDIDAPGLDGNGDRAAA
jgi:hypothetical protein